jgi:hypothetical protein
VHHLDHHAVDIAVVRGNLLHQIPEQQRLAVVDACAMMQQL